MTTNAVSFFCNTKHSNNGNLPCLGPWHASINISYIVIQLQFLKNQCIFNRIKLGQRGSLDCSVRPEKKPCQFSLKNLFKPTYLNFLNVPSFSPDFLLFILTIFCKDQIQNTQIKRFQPKQTKIKRQKLQIELLEVCYSHLSSLSSSADCLEYVRKYDSLLPLLD